MHIPPFAATVLFELYKCPDDESYYVRLFYKNTSAVVQPILIPSCGFQCPLEIFRANYDAVIPTRDFDTECEVSTAPMEDLNFGNLEI